MGLTIAIIGFILHIITRSIDRFLNYAYLLLVFIFAFVVSNREFSVFYILLYLIAIVISELFKIDTEMQAGTGLKLTLLSLGLGTAIYLVIAVISSRVGGNIVGTPDLGISSTQEIARNFKPLFESMLGIIENFFFFMVFDMMLVLGIFALFIPVVMPLIITSLIAAIFHASAYSVSISLMLWAMMAFGLFIISRFALKDSLAADTGHWLNNLVTSVSRGLSIVS